MQTYNQISDDCFTNCVFSFNTRDLNKEEVFFFKSYFMMSRIISKANYLILKNRLFVLIVVYSVLWTQGCARARRLLIFSIKRWVELRLLSRRRKCGNHWDKDPFPDIFNNKMILNLEFLVFAFFPITSIVYCFWLLKNLLVTWQITCVIYYWVYVYNTHLYKIDTHLWNKKKISVFAHIINLFMGFFIIKVFFRNYVFNTHYWQSKLLIK